MSKEITTQSGTKIVITTVSGALFSSRLYVNGGETATLVAAKHKSEKGAVAWAKKAVLA